MVEFGGAVATTSRRLPKPESVATLTTVEAVTPQIQISITPQMAPNIL